MPVLSSFVLLGHGCSGSYGCSLLLQLSVRLLKYPRSKYDVYGCTQALLITSVSIQCISKAPSKGFHRSPLGDYNTATEMTPEGHDNMRASFICSHNHQTDPVTYIVCKLFAAKCNTG